MVDINYNRDVFEAIAETYIRGDSHWGSDFDIIKTSLDELVRKEPIVRWLDIGCGAGFHLTSIAQLYPEIEAVGMDFSPAMLGQTKTRVKESDIQNVTFCKTDIIDHCFIENYHLLSFLNNGLGNLYRDDSNPTQLRTRIFQKIANALAVPGYFILSVYNKEKLEQNYGHNFTLLSDSSDFEKGNIFIEYTAKNNERVTYYSHWFSEEEVSALAESSGLKIDFLERRMSRFLVRLKSEEAQ